MLQKTASLLKVKFVIEAEYDPSVITYDTIGMKLADSLAWVEGVGVVRINPEIETEGVHDTNSQ